MNHDRLRLDLAELADEVTPVDLRDRALRTSRRLGIQRAVVTSAAAVLLLAAATGTALAVRPEGRAPAPAPAGPSVTVTGPPVDVTPSPAPSRAPTTEPSTAPSGGASEPAPTARIGLVFYVPKEVVSGVETVSLRSWRPGEQPTTLADLPQVSALTNASVSPDGRRVAWVDRGGKDVATLFVADADGSHRQSMATDVDEYCVTPTWAPDSRHLLFRANAPSGGPGRYGVLDTSDGGAVRWWTAQPDACHALWSADGKTLAMNTDAGVALFDTTGKKKDVVPGLSASGAWQSNHVASLAPDAARISLFRTGKGEDAGDVGRLLRVNAVLETANGKEVGLPLGGRELEQVFFQPDGSMVVRVRDGAGHTVLLIDRDGRKITEKPEPPALKDMLILNVAG